MLGEFIWQGRDVDRVHLSSLLRNASAEQQEHVNPYRQLAISIGVLNLCSIGI